MGKESVCDGPDRRVCCLETVSGSQAWDSLVSALGREDTVLECVLNPCRHMERRSIPWYGREGCFPLGVTARSSCVMTLGRSQDEEEEQVICEPPTSFQDDLTLRGVASSAYRSKCPPRKVWSRFLDKCVGRF